MPAWNLRSFPIAAFACTCLAPVGCRHGGREAAVPAAPAETADASASLVAPSALKVDATEIRSDVAYLADDARGGRAPGTEGDTATQAYIEGRMRRIGLAPLFASGYRQPFEVVEGVQVRPGEPVELSMGKVRVEVHPFAFTSSGAVGPAPMVFVGTGVTPSGMGSGAYGDGRVKVKGAIAVAEAKDPDDPHVGPAALRVASRAIAARDHGAVAFVWWDPKADPVRLDRLRWGRADDVGLPVVACGGPCAELLARRFGAPPERLSLGKRARGRAHLRVPVERARVETANVGGKLPAGRGTRGILVVGAHMDHLGMGRPGSLAPGVQEVHNGADDNASGVAAMLALARLFASRPAEQRPFELWFVAFGAEEMGLLGSKHFVASIPEADRQRIVAMVNFDMVGRLTEDRGLVVSGVDTADGWGKILDAVHTDLPVRRKPGGYGPSDHSSFYEAKIPVLHLFTGAHEDYHKPTDDLEDVAFRGIASIVEWTARVIEQAGRAPGLAYRETARPQPVRTGFRVSLGTVPDYAADVRGVRLSGVRKGGAADRAGLRKGDVIVALDGREVDSIEAYMAAFGGLRPGKAAEVIVLRDGKRRVLSIVPDPPRRGAR